MTVLNGAISRVQASVAPAVQAALCATAAWWVATTFLQVPQNFFAPFAAIVVVLGGRGGRGPRALRVVGGVVLGVALGEFSLVVGQNPLTLFLAAAVAMVIAATFTPDPLVMIQAGIGAVLVAITANPLSGFGRIAAALIGGAIALVATQVAFTPSPGRLAGPAVGRVLAAAADVLDDPRSGNAVRDLAGALGALDEVRGGLTRIGRFTVRGWLRGEEVRAAAESVDAAADLAVALLGHPPQPGAAPGPTVRTARMRDLAHPAHHVGRPGRRVPGATEIRALDETADRSG